MNTTLLDSMICRYNELAFTHRYIFGFYYQNNVYMVITDNQVLPYVMKLDRASRGQGFSIRFSPTKEQKIFLLSKGATVICSKSFFENETRESKYNKGEIFEKMVTEYFGKEWKKDHVPFTEDGDLTINGKAYQIKFEKATFANERTLARM